MSWEALPVVTAGDQLGATVFDPITDDLNLLGLRPGASVFGGQTANQASPSALTRIPVSLPGYDQDPTGLPLWFTSSTFDLFYAGVQYAEFTAQTPGFYKPKAQLQILTDDTNGFYREACWLLNGTIIFQTVAPLGGRQTITCSAPVTWLAPGDFLQFEMYAVTNATTLDTQTLGTFASVEWVSK